MDPQVFIVSMLSLAAVTVVGAGFGYMVTEGESMPGPFWKSGPGITFFVCAGLATAVQLASM